MGIRMSGGMSVNRVDWDEGPAGEGLSFARAPDGTGEFRTVDTPTPDAPNGSGN